MIWILFGENLLPKDYMEDWQDCKFVPQVDEFVFLKGRYYRVVSVTWLGRGTVYLRVENVVSMNKKEKS